MSGEILTLREQAKALTEEGQFVLSSLVAAVEKLGNWEEKVNDLFDGQGYDGEEVPEGLEDLHKLWISLPEAGEIQGRIYDLAHDQE